MLWCKWRCFVPFLLTFSWEPFPNVMFVFFYIQKKNLTPNCLSKSMADRFKKTNLVLRQKLWLVTFMQAISTRRIYSITQLIKPTPQPFLVFFVLSSTSGTISRKYFAFLETSASFFFFEQEERTCNICPISVHVQPQLISKLGWDSIWTE